jgi:hypothetical protein
MKTNEKLSDETQNGNLDKPMLPLVFLFNGKVIWDSHFGYEIGYFLGEGNQYHTYLIDARNGLIHEPCSYSKSEIHKYTNELIDKLTEKYGYEKRFSDIF